MMDHCVIRVPATSANLGVGFDCLGLALELVASFEFERADTLEIVGAPQQYAGPDNLVWQSLLFACRELGLDEPQGMRITVNSPIPLTGGLGSSATCAVAGVAAAQLMQGGELKRDEVLRLACTLEGHPDNVGPAVLGGLVSSFTEDGLPYSIRSEVSDDLRFVVVAPPYAVRTEQARAAMPREVPLETAVWQMGRCVAMARALETGDTALLARACHDRLHEPYRRELISDYDELKRASLAAGAAAFFISGSGSAMVAVCERELAAQVAADLHQAHPDCWVRELGAFAAGLVIGQN